MERAHRPERRIDPAQRGTKFTAVAAERSSAHMWGGLGLESLCGMTVRPWSQTRPANVNAALSIGIHFSLLRTAVGGYYRCAEGRIEPVAFDASAVIRYQGTILASGARSGNQLVAIASSQYLEWAGENPRNAPRRNAPRCIDFRGEIHSIERAFRLLGCVNWFRMTASHSFSRRIREVPR